ncbi:MAG: hypothetical protein ACQGQO_00985 [Sphaerochaetaceae bacterium]
MNFTISGIALIYVAAIVIFGKALKSILGDRTVGKLKLSKLLPVFLFIFSEILTILGAIIGKTDIWTAVVSGIVYTGVAAWGYDAVKGAISQGVK